MNYSVMFRKSRPGYSETRKLDWLILVTWMGPSPPREGLLRGCAKARPWKKWSDIKSWACSTLQSCKNVKDFMNICFIRLFMRLFMSACVLKGGLCVLLTIFQRILDFSTRQLRCWIYRQTHMAIHFQCTRSSSFLMHYKIILLLSSIHGARIILFWNSPPKRLILYTFLHGLAVTKATKAPSPIVTVTLAFDALIGWWCMPPGDSSQSTNWKWLKPVSMVCSMAGMRSQLVTMEELRLTGSNDEAWPTLLGQHYAMK